MPDTPFYPLATSSWGGEEVAALHRVIESGRFTMGKHVAAFEREFAEHVGAKHAVMVNSGSSANLLAIAALLYQSTPLVPGDEVIVPAVSWSTTYYPVHQAGLKLRFVDVDRGSFTIDPSAVARAVTPRTKAIFAVNLLGSACAYDELVQLADDRGLALIEDNCESMGGQYRGRALGTIGRLGTFSTFFSHHISTMEGGLVVTNDDELREIVVCLRAHGWTRDLDQGNRLTRKTGDAFHDSFRFILPGYNVRPTELNGAVGSCQLKKLPEFVAARRSNASYAANLLEGFDHCRLQRPHGESSWFGFALLLSGALAGRRGTIIELLREAGIECRPVVAGNFLKQPVMRHLTHDATGVFPNAEDVDQNAFFVGNHHYDIRPQVDRLMEVLAEAARR